MGNMQLKEIVSIQAASINPMDAPDKLFHLYSLPSFDENQKREEVYGRQIQSNKSIVPDKCILFNKLNVRFQRIWLIDNDDEDKICSTEFLPLIVDETKVDFYYCYFLLHSPGITNYLTGQNTNTSGSHKRIDPDDFLSIEVQLPTLPEQKRIGKFLYDIEKKITVNRQINDYLAAMAQQLYDYWFVQFDFPDENGKPYKSSGGKMMWNDKLKREIPVIWTPETISSKHIYNSDYTANGSFASLAENVRYNEGDPYAMLIRIVDLNGDFSENGNYIYLNKHGYNFLKSCSLIGDEIIICNVGNAGATYRCPRLHRPMSLGPNGLVVNDATYNNFLFEYFKSPIGQHQIQTISSGSIQMKFNKTNFRELPIPFPDDRVIKLFNDAYGKIFEEQNLVWEERRELSDLKNKLLPLLMNGQVSVKPLNNHLSHD